MRKVVPPRSLDGSGERSEEGADRAAALERLRARFLAPDRPDLAALREAAARASSVEAFVAGLEGRDPGWPRARRWFRLSRAQAAARGAGPALRASWGPAVAVADRPPTLASAALFAATADAMAAAEDAARAFAQRAWAALGSTGPPPVDVVWHASAWGACPNSVGSPRQLRSLGSEAWMAWAEEARGTSRADRAVGTGWTTPFLAVVHALYDDEEWARGAAQGRVSGLSPAGALLDLWRTGCGIRGVGAEAISLFVPDQDGAAATRVDALRGHRAEQARADARLCRVCVEEGSDSGAVVRALQGGGRSGRVRVGRVVHGEGVGSCERARIARFDAGVAGGAAAAGPAGPAARSGRSARADPRPARRGRVAGGVGAAGDALNRCVARERRPGGVRPVDLVAAGISPDAQDGNGRTALHFAPSAPIRSRSGP